MINAALLCEKIVASSFELADAVLVNEAIAGTARVKIKRMANMIRAFFISVLLDFNGLNIV